GRAGGVARGEGRELLHQGGHPDPRGRSGPLYAPARPDAEAGRPPPCTVQAQGDGSGMIITVTLNAAIDRTLSVPNFRRGRRHRTVEQRTMAGGKGVNVARTLKTLGQPVIA